MFTLPVFAEKNNSSVLWNRYLIIFSLIFRGSVGPTLIVSKTDILNKERDKLGFNFL